MTRLAWLSAAVVVFAVLATANAGGYRFGVSDQAFYVPAIELRVDATLFPRDRAVIEPQMRFWVGDEILGGFVRQTGISLPTLFAGLHVATLMVLALGGVTLARALGCGWWTVTVLLLLMTLRHRISRTGANSIEGYMHPRMLAFGLGLVALSAVARLRTGSALAWTALAALVHPSTAIWFAGVIVIATIWRHPSRTWLFGMVAAVAVIAAVLLGAGIPRSLPLMDAEWRAVLGDRDYLFSLDWPAYAWLFNLTYPVVLLVAHRRRVRRGVAVPGEPALVAGLLALVLVFLATLPLVERHLAFFVQLQANRVFWLLDTAAALMLAWWLMEDLAVRWTVPRRVAVVLLVGVLSAARGFYVLQIETKRPLVEMSLADDTWADVMQWLRTQPPSWHVLADPGHVWKYGPSIRVAALKDTLLESGKDPAMAMYDRPLAMRVAERTRALSAFDTFTESDVRRLAATYDLDVFVDHTTRHLTLPELFRNRDFVVYDLR